MNPSPELKWAVSAVRQAMIVCETVRSALDSRTDSVAKSDDSPVTLADLACQAVIAHSLRQAYPADPLVGEEDTDVFEGEAGASLLARVAALGASVFPALDAAATAAAIAHGRGTGGDRGRFWTLDPIDGTKGFLRGDQYAVALALVVDGQVRLGVLGCPNLPGQNGRGALFAAERGAGTWMVPASGWPQATACRVTPRTPEQLHGAVFAESFESGHSAHGTAERIAAKLGITAAPIRMDSQAKYGLLARGGADVYLRLPTRAGYQEKIWDHAAGVIVIEEAGGTVTDMHGRPLDFGRGRTLSANQGVIATNGPLHPPVLAAAQSVLAG